MNYHFYFFPVAENQNGNFIRSNYVISHRQMSKFTQSRLLILCDTGRTVPKPYGQRTLSLDEASWSGQNKLERQDGG